MPGIDTGQDQLNIHIQRASMLMKLRKLDMAGRELHQALRLDPQHAEAHHMLGVVLWAKGNLREAKKEIEAALGLAPGTAEFYNTLGYLVAGLGKKGAADHFQKALSLAPEVPKYHFCYAEWLAAVGRQNDAWEETEIALRLNPEYGDAHKLQADILHHRGKEVEAEKSVLKALSINPENADAHSLLGDIYMDMHRGGKALVCYRSALRLAPTRKPLKRKIVLALQARIPILGLFWKVGLTLDRFPNRTVAEILLLGLIWMSWVLMSKGESGGYVIFCLYCVPFVTPIGLLIWVADPLITRAFLKGWIKIDEMEDDKPKKGINARLAPIMKGPVLILILIFTLLCSFVIMYLATMKSP